MSSHTQANDPYKSVYAAMKAYIMAPGTSGGDLVQAFKDQTGLLSDVQLCQLYEIAGGQRNGGGLSRKYRPDLEAALAEAGFPVKRNKQPVNGEITAAKRHGFLNNPRPADDVAGPVTAIQSAKTELTVEEQIDQAWKRHRATQALEEAANRRRELKAWDKDRAKQELAEMRQRYQPD